MVAGKWDEKVHKAARAEADARAPYPDQAPWGNALIYGFMTWVLLWSFQQAAGVYTERAHWVALGFSLLAAVIGYLDIRSKQKRHARVFAEALENARWWAEHS